MPKKKAKVKPKKEAQEEVIEITDLEFATIPIDSIHPNEYNPNRQSDHDFELLCRSIEEDGFTQPILVHKPSMTIVDGEHRWRACKALEYPEVPVAFSEMDIVQMKIATLRHNRARGSEDIQRAADLFRELKSMGAEDWAADSLMLDDVDLEMLTKTTTGAQLNLRTEDMSYDEVQETLDREAELEEIRAEEEKLMAKKDSDKYVLQMTYLSEEASLVREVVGKKHAQGILNLCEFAKANGLASA